MATDTQIAQMACVLLGTRQVTSLDDTANKAARELAAVWDVRRDACLRARMWRFALARRAVAKDPDAPAFGFNYRYPVPANFLRLVQVNDAWSPDMVDYRTGETAPWQLEAGFILTDLGSPLKMRFIQKMNEAADWDPCFASYFAGDIAWHACEAITASSAKKADCERHMMMSLEEANRANAIETPPREFGDGSWQLSRAWP